MNWRAHDRVVEGTADCRVHPLPGSEFPPRPGKPSIYPGSVNWYRTSLGRIKGWPKFSCRRNTHSNRPWHTVEVECVAHPKRDSLTPSFILYPSMWIVFKISRCLSQRVTSGGARRKRRDFFWSNSFSLHYCHWPSNRWLDSLYGFIRKYIYK